MSSKICPWRFIYFCCSLINSGQSVACSDSVLNSLSRTGHVQSQPSNRRRTPSTTPSVKRDLWRKHATVIFRLVHLTCCRIVSQKSVRRRWDAGVVNLRPTIAVSYHRRQYIDVGTSALQIYNQQNTTRWCNRPLGSNFESCFWRAVSSHSSHHPHGSPGPVKPIYAHIWHKTPFWFISISVSFIFSDLNNYISCHCC